MSQAEVTLDALHAFAVFADHRNFTHAAEELHLSQPALHVKVNKLGASLGVRLYERDGRALVLTSSGLSVARFATMLDQQIRDFVAGLSADIERPLVLAAGEGAHLYVIANGVRRLLARGDEIRLLTTNTTETLDAVRSEHADVGVAVLDRRPRDMRVTKVATYPQVLVMPAGHMLARARSLRLADLEDASLVMPPPGRPHRTALDHALRRAGVKCAIGVESEGWAQMLHFVSLGVGLAVVNGCVTPRDDLVARPIEDLPSVAYSAVWRRADGDDARLSALVDILGRECAMSDSAVRRSKQLSWLLRHGAGEAHLSMDEAGWVDVADVLDAIGLNRTQLLEVVATNDKGRLELVGERVRACQGHSLQGMPVTREALEASWQPLAPTASLWHGTRVRSIDGIAARGIHAGDRTHVHLAPRPDSHVGKRASVDVVLEISPELLSAAGVGIFRAPNGVILVRHVPADCIIGVRAGSTTRPHALDRVHRTLGLPIE